jgi:hypothetical protein
MMKIKLIPAASIVCVALFFATALPAHASAYSPYEALSNSIAELITSITNFIQTGNFATVAASVSTPAGPTFKVFHVNDAVSDQKLFKPADAQAGFSVSLDAWKLVSDPTKSQSLQLFNTTSDPGLTKDVYASRPGLANSLRARYLNWRVLNTEVPLEVGLSVGGVTIKDDTYTFPATTLGQVVFTQSSSQKIGKGDFTFATHIKSIGRDKTVRVIASQPNAWVLQINASNRLELVLFDGSSTSMPVTIADDTNSTDTLIAQNVDYDVMFNVVGMPKVKNFARLAVRKSGDNASFAFAGDGVGVTSVASSNSPIGLGGDKASTLFSGVIDAPRFFSATFNRAQMESVYTEQNDSCTSDGVTVPGGTAAVFYDTSVVTSPDTCEDHSEQRMCLNSKLRGHSTYVFSGCRVATATPIVTTLARTPGIPTVTTFPDGTVWNIQKTIDGGRPSKPGLDDHLYEIALFSSTNTAKTWNRLSTVLSTTTPKDHFLSVANTLVTKLKNGDLMAVFRQHKLSTPTLNTDVNDVVNGLSVDEYVLKSVISKDQGQTWQNFAVIDSRIKTGDFGTWEPFVIEPSKRPNVIQVYYALERHRNSKCPSVDDTLTPAQDVMMRESVDGGKSWGAPRVALSRGVSREGVPAVVELSDGSLLAVSETWRESACGQANADLTIGQAQSKDGGLTWNYLPFVFQHMQTNARQSWPYLTKLADGRVLLKFASTENYENPTVATRTESRDIELLASKNVPTYDNPPQWNLYPIVAFPMMKLGNVAQLANGDIIAAGATGADAKINVIPLQLFGSILK